jgi:hypothetical protein
MRKRVYWDPGDSMNKCRKLSQSANRIVVLDQYQHPDFYLGDFRLSLYGTRFTEMVED